MPLDKDCQKSLEGWLEQYNAFFQSVVASDISPPTQDALLPQAALAEPKNKSDLQSIAQQASKTVQDTPSSSASADQAQKAAAVATRAEKKMGQLSSPSASDADSVKAVASMDREKLAKAFHDAAQYIHDTATKFTFAWKGEAVRVGDADPFSRMLMEGLLVVLGIYQKLVPISSSILAKRLYLRVRALFCACKGLVTDTLKQVSEKERVIATGRVWGATKRLQAVSLDERKVLRTVLMEQYQMLNDSIRELVEVHRADAIETEEARKIDEAGEEERQEYTAQEQKLIAHACSLLKAVRSPLRTIGNSILRLKKKSEEDSDLKKGFLPAELRDIERVVERTKQVVKQTDEYACALLMLPLDEDSLVAIRKALQEAFVVLLKDCTQAVASSTYLEASQSKQILAELKVSQNVVETLFAKIPATSCT